MTISRPCDVNVEVKTSKANEVTAKLVSTVKAEMALELMDRRIGVMSCSYISC